MNLSCWSTSQISRPRQARAWREDINCALLGQSIVYVCVWSSSSSRSWCLQEAGGSGCVLQFSVVVQHPVQCWICQHPLFLYHVLLKASFLTLVFWCHLVDVYISLITLEGTEVICGRKFKRFPVPCVVNVCYICFE